MNGRKVITCLLAAALLLLSGCGEKEHRHEIAYVPEQPPACTESGIAGHWRCETCGETFSDEAGKQPAAPPVLEELGHNVVAEETEATCEEEGIRRLVCLRCGKSKEEVIPPTGHLFGSWNCVRSPSCKEEGAESRFCAYCGMSEARPLAPLGHEYGKDNVCTRCESQLLSTPGLAYAPVTGADGNLRGYSVSIGTSSASEIVVAPYYEGMPVLSVSPAGFLNSFITAFTSYAALEEIGSEAFRGCTLLNAIDLPDSVVSVGDAAFYGCSGAEELTIGSSLVSVGRAAFFNLRSLGRIRVAAENPVFAGEGNCLVERATGKLLLGCSQSTIPETVKEIADFAFYNNDGLKRAVIPSGITRIGMGAFFGCTSLGEFSYAGSEAAWERIEKGERWHDYAAFTEITFMK